MFYDFKSVTREISLEPLRPGSSGKLEVPAQKIKKKEKNIYLSKKGKKFHENCQGLMLWIWAIEENLKCLYK